MTCSENKNDFMDNDHEGDWEKEQHQSNMEIEEQVQEEYSYSYSRGRKKQSQVWKYGVSKANSDAEYSLCGRRVSIKQENMTSFMHYILTKHKDLRESDLLTKEVKKKAEERVKYKDTERKHNGELLPFINRKGKLSHTRQN